MQVTHLYQIISPVKNWFTTIWELWSLAVMPITDIHTSHLYTAPFRDSSSPCKWNGVKQIEWGETSTFYDEQLRGRGGWEGGWEGSRNKGGGREEEARGRTGRTGGRGKMGDTFYFPSLDMFYVMCSTWRALWVASIAQSSWSLCRPAANMRTCCFEAS